jgi:hypothetical protein
MRLATLGADNLRLSTPLAAIEAHPVKERPAESRLAARRWQRTVLSPLWYAIRQRELAAAFPGELSADAVAHLWTWRRRHVMGGPDVARAPRRVRPCCCLIERGLARVLRRIGVDAVEGVPGRLDLDEREALGEVGAGLRAMAGVAALDRRVVGSLESGLVV